MPVFELFRTVRDTVVERDWWRGNGSGNGSVDRVDAGAPEETPSTSLFQCQACDVVYVAIEKDRCRKCDAAVEAVPTSFSTV